MSTENSHPDDSLPEEASSFNPLSSGCPWLKKKSANPILNPRNMMPEISQAPSDFQQTALSTARQVSSIPKTGASAHWEYPSPQQFFNALLRRNKSAEEETMASVVHVHNKVNEDSWNQVLEWEKLHSKCVEPSLQRFVGKSEELSPKAFVRQKLKMGAGEELFDRHDWFVDRCGEKSVRYIIDYYDTSGVAGADPRALNVRIDTRPALDSFGAVWDRIRKPVLDFFSTK